VGGDKQPEPRQQFIADAAKGSEPLFLTSLHRCRIIETPVDALRLTRKKGAAFFCPITHRDDEIERFSQKLVN
jgi:hypothetical protein